MATRLLLPLLLFASCVGLAPAHALELGKTQCVAAAKPGGGFELTCKLVRAGLLEGKYIHAPMRMSYLPGGIGALAYDAFATQRPVEAETLVAFSSGSLLNLTQGKFGPHDESAVRWVAGVAADYGVVVDSSKVVFGAGGTVGSQDWGKAAMAARAAGIDHRNMRLVAFEGGGEALTALQGNHVQVYMGDASETAARLATGASLRVLAVMSELRLPGRLAQVPTAREAGYDLVWPIIRGFYVGPQVSDADFRAWAEVFARTLASKSFERLRSEHGLYDFAMTGPEFGAYVKRTVGSYRKVAQEFGLKVASWRQALLPT